MMAVRTIYPTDSFSGTLNVPGDKSISQRVAMLTTLANGISEVRGFLRSEDAMSTLGAVCALGASAVFDGEVLKITGTRGLFNAPKHPLNMGNSGTGTRLLAGLLAGQTFSVAMIGDESLSQRPMNRIKYPLKQMGARIELIGRNDTLPMTICGAPLCGIHYELLIASAQVKSCVLLAGLFAEGTTTVVESCPTRDHTEKLFQTLKLPIQINGSEISVQGFGPCGPDIAPCLLSIPGDFSSAAFWIAAVAARPGATLTIQDVGLNPRRTALLNVLRRMGAQINTKITKKQHDPIGSISVYGTKLSGTKVGGNEVPNLIDELPIIAVVGALAEGETSIRDAVELRVKESDRIAVMAAHLRAFGVEVEELPDGLTVCGPTMLSVPKKPLASYGDHRITMAMAILASFAKDPVKLEDVNCVTTSYPEFWDHFKQLGGRVK